MAPKEKEVWPERQRQDSTTVTSSSASTHLSHDEEHGDGYDGPAAFLTRTISQASHPSLSRRVTSVRTTGTTDPGFEVDWEGEDDPNNPKNWPAWYKGVVIFAVSFSTVTV